MSSAASAPKAWSGAGGGLDAVQPIIRHFHTLDDASEFINASTGRAVGFFSAVEAAEHAVFLTVAKQLASNENDETRAGIEPLPVRLGRATVGRGTSGASIYLYPRATAAGGARKAGLALLTYQYRVPESPNDASLEREWRRLHPPPRPPVPPPAKMWERVLEAEALGLHRFLHTGNLPDATALTKSSLDAMASSSAAIGLLIYPPRMPASIRKYHLNRVRRVAARYSPLRCEQSARDGETYDLTAAAAKGSSGWPIPYYRCELAPPAEATRFAFANASAELSALLATRLGVTPASLPAAISSAGRRALRQLEAGSKVGGGGGGERGGGGGGDDGAVREVKFALLAHEGVDGPWSAHPLDAAVSEASVEAFVKRFAPLPWSGGDAQGEAEGASAKDGGGGGVGKAEERRRAMLDRLNKEVGGKEEL